MAEVDLYAPVKLFLERQGYEVKGEVDDCDVVAVRGEEPPVVVELKQQLDLALSLQAGERLGVSDTVYIAFRVGKSSSASWRSRSKQVKSLLRRLGVGLLTVSVQGEVEAVLDPAPYRPRSSRDRRERLLKEFVERVGDPEPGGSAARERMTSYRQDVIRCARELVDGAVLKVQVIRDRTGLERVGNILIDNHYGWFERVKIGHYQISPRGRREIVKWLGLGDKAVEIGG